MQRHGQKVYMQLLIDPHRADLIKEIADQNGIRVTAVMRDFIYERLAQLMPANVYKIAEAKDKALWQESVKNRIAGRKTKPKACDMEKTVDRVLEEVRNE